MPGAAGADDPALEQARLAQPPPRAYQDGWRSRYAAVTRPGAPPPTAPDSPAPVTPSAAQAETGDASQGVVPMRAGAGGAAAVDGAAQNTEAKQAARPEPVPPLRSGEQRQAALDAARQRNTELKALRTRLQAGQLTVAELLALAQSGHAAGRMLVRTALLALPGIRRARASQLMTQAGIDPSRRAGSLTARQRERLLDAVTAVNPELAAAVASTAPATAPAPGRRPARPVRSKQRRRRRRTPETTGASPPGTGGCGFPARTFRLPSWSRSAWRSR